MYFVIVILLVLVCPLGSIAIEAFHSHQALTDLILIGRWWVFWAMGVRFLMAGFRQVFQPRFTAEKIFGIQEMSVLPAIREIGFANLSMGTLGICSLVRPDWVLPAAIVGGLYYGFAGMGHLPQKDKNAKEYTAMISDWFAAAVLAACVLKRLI